MAKASKPKKGYVYAGETAKDKKKKGKKEVAAQEQVDTGGTIGANKDGSLICAPNESE